ncbi:D-alanyl-D-alanine carboxypeptidase/D-alanyl-D-alanine endopeptidase [Synechocystis sp. PCC 7509]|uniref:D-alanyl-D-alanine carboxypeptidase/D-alanyl-D-alanine endopeptidase n=1 Tax=Synechocystis sp. PCC 7509 TaxID=927677 RepID=UPI0002AC9B01|nr:D-alanyl-D-alanine carboxypeptidase/D-alanyl-D-alanine-endopeptidase [Synechocystis sp. PCC 7509]
MLTTIIKRTGLIIILFSAQFNIRQAVAQTDPQPRINGEANRAICPAQLSKAIETVTNRPQFSRGRWGIVVQTLSPSTTIYSRDAQKYFIPASNVKLLLTAAALHKLGANFRIRTSIYGTSNGVLRIVGRGDPSLTDVQLKQLAQQLKQKGVNQVIQLIADDNYFQGNDIVDPSWEWEDVQADYGAPINSLIVNQNAVSLQLFPQKIGQPLGVVWGSTSAAKQWQIDNKSLTTKPGEATTVNVSRALNGSTLKISGNLSIDAPSESFGLAVIDPVANFLQHLRQALVTEKIKYNVPTKSIAPPLAVFITELAAVESVPLSQLLLETNLNSNNLYAEALLRSLGVKVYLPQSTAATKGLEVVKQTLTQLGVNPAGYVLADGSGLSRHNLVSPEAISQTLSAMGSSPYAAIYRASLPVAGVSGTMTNRLKNTPAQGVVSAKTGTISGAIALSGYINAPNYEPLVFSIIVNQSDQNAATIRQAVDEIVLLLVSLRRC